ncbi:MAG: hypothetical protein JWM37_373 [Candidatus Saccharibacteria bacterium]|nr:hypothetical protein [Candidatus Saccharibacteria bacterium]
MDVANAWQAATSKLPLPTQDGLNEWIGLLPSIVWDVLHVETDETLLEFTSSDEATDASMFAKLYQYAQMLQEQPQLLRGQVNLDTKETYRPLLQWLGGYFVKMIGPGVWYDEIIRRIKHAEAEGCELVVVTGLRFPGDAERILEVRGIVVRIIRSDAEERDETDPTERERLTIPYQVTIYNDGTLEDLATVASQFYHDLTSGQLQVAYHAGPAPMPAVV